MSGTEKVPLGGPSNTSEKGFVPPSPPQPAPVGDPHRDMGAGFVPPPPPRPAPQPSPPPQQPKK